MKKVICILFAALLAAASLLGCGRRRPRAGSGAPEATEVPQAEYSLTHLVKYWPEDADYETCDYSCVAEIPQFSGEHIGGYNMNKAVSEYIERLDARIESRYMPASVADKPHTEVKCSVEYVGRITNVIFSEEHSYEAQPYTETKVIMLNEVGGELNLCDLVLNYHAESMAAERIAELTESTPGMIPCGADRVLSGIDVTNGVKATEDGCVVYVKEGIIAPLDSGEIAVPLTLGELCPTFVGEGKLLSIEEYRTLTEFLSYVSDAAVVRQENIIEGALSQYEASSFMGEYALSLGLVPSAGRISMPRADFEAAYRACFGTDFPGADEDGHSIRLENGVYSIAYSSKPYVYNVDMLDASEENGVVTVRGDMIFGTFGYAYTEYVCHVTVALVRDPDSPFGFRLTDYIMSV